MNKACVALIFLLSCLIFSGVYANDEEFYIFDVGQGNAQLVLYKKAKIGFLYDCGTSSSRKHIKLQSLTTTDWNAFFTKEIKEIPQLEEIEMTSELNIMEKNLDVLMANIGMEEELGELIQSHKNSVSVSHSISNKANVEKIESISDTIKAVIEQANLNLLVIFLSHSDKDHINLVNEKIIPSGLKIIAFLGGDWLGKDEEGNITKALGFFSSRKQSLTWVEFPFYWGWSYYQYPKNYIDLKEALLSGNKNNVDKIKYLTLSKHNPEHFFQGSLSSLFHNIAMRDISFIEYYYKDLSSLEEFIASECVYIWSMNPHFYSQNAQSTVVSFKLPFNKVRLICTGDAEESTFWRIFKEKDKKLSNYYFPLEVKENILVIPHHGSKDNISETMIKLFNPSIFVISAGNGGQYAHPHVEAINWLRQHQGSTIFQPKEEKATFMAFSSDKKAILKSSIEKEKYGIPILSTNVMGTIKYTENNFYSLFKSLFNIEDGIYRIDFSKRVPFNEISGNLLGIKDQPCCYKANDKFYYKVSNEEGESLYYILKEVDTGES